MSVKILHIGLPKTGTTVLQKYIFPDFEKYFGIKYIKLTKKAEDRDNVKFHLLENYREFEKTLPSNFIISNERLFSHSTEFKDIEKSFEILKKNFSPNTKILITLRNPYNFLNSTYVQSVQMYYVNKPENFFINNSFDKVRNWNQYNLFKFNYNDFIKLYKSYFKKVVIVKYENLNNLSFLNELMVVDKYHLELMKKKMQIKDNLSTPEIGIKIYIFLSRFIDLKKFDNFFRKKITPSGNIIIKIKNKIFSQFLLRDWFQWKLHKYFSMKKYYIDKKFIPLDLLKLEKEYRELNIKD